jgi:hypothetical protein
VPKRPGNKTEDWRKLPAYGLEAGATLTIGELRRGEAQAPPDGLRLSREFWLDLDGPGVALAFARLLGDN